MESSYCRYKFYIQSHGIHIKIRFIPILFTVLIIAQQLSTTEPGKVKYSICETKECHILAKIFKKTLNFSSSPCDNFLSFVCENLMASSEIADNRVDFNVIGNLREDVQRYTVELLGSPEIKKPRNSTETARAFYQGCLAAENETASSFAVELTKLLKDIGGMPLVPASNYNPAITWPMRISKVFRYFELDLIIGMEVGPDLTKARSKIYSFYQAEKFGLSRANLVRNSTKSKDIISSYKKYITDTLCILRQESCPPVPNAETTKEIEKLVDFEIALAKITLPPEKRRDLFNNYKKKSLKELAETYPDTPWLPIVKDIFKETDVQFDENTIVSFMEPEFFRDLPLLMKKTDPGTIANYIGWRVFQTMPVFYTQALKKHTFEFHKLTSGYKELPSRKKICAVSAIDSFPLSVGRLYIQKYFPAGVKEDLEDMIKYLRASMKNMLLKIKWMDEATKKESLLKLEKIKSQIGYPSWVMDDKKLNEEEGLPDPFDKNEFVASSIRFFKYKADKQLRKLRKPIDDEHWSDSPATVNAFYDSTRNNIAFPAGILQPPIYQMNAPRSLNFGAAGSIIGHEITHGFDDVGNQFDGDGNLRNWWTSKTKAEFNKRKECFIYQYGNVTDKQTNIPINGELTVGENIADNGGIRESYDAYKMTNPKDERLPGLESVTHEQLFFISYGRAWCGKYRTEALRSRILTDPHSPNMYRVYFPPMNFKKFAEAFNCPPGSTMNPAERCVAW